MYYWLQSNQNDHSDCFLTLFRCWKITSLVLRKIKHRSAYAQHSSCLYFNEWNFLKLLNCVHLASLSNY